MLCPVSYKGNCIFSALNQFNLIIHMTNCLRKLCFVCVAVSAVIAVSAQSKSKASSDTTKAAKPPADAPKTGPKPYKDVITDKAKTSKGFFTVHKIEDKYYLEISPALFGRDILMVNRVSKASIES